MLAIYLHIPWCLERCPYCDFNTRAARSWPEAEYAAALKRELQERLAQEGFAGREVTTIFFGGGTPSLFEAHTIASLIDSIATAGSLASEPEITLETNPGSTDEARLRDFRSAGINRLSLGVQTFHEGHLHALGRQHGADDSRRVLREARAAGFANLSLDLIHAIPGQSAADLEADLDEALSFETEHVSAYALTFEPGTPMTRDLERGRIQRLSNEDEAAMFERIHERLPAAGLPSYEISNFARPGFEARHNQAYWRGTPYIGVGAGAHSFLPRPTDRENPGRRWMNLREPGEYIEAASRGGLAEAEAEELTAHQAMGEHIWLALRESQGLDAQAFEQRFGCTTESAWPAAANLVETGLLTRDAEGWKLSARGRLFADRVFASFFESP